MQWLQRSALMRLIRWCVVSYGKSKLVEAVGFHRFCRNQGFKKSYCSFENWWDALVSRWKFWSRKV